MAQDQNVRATRRCIIYPQVPPVGVFCSQFSLPVVLRNSGLVPCHGAPSLLRPFDSPHSPLIPSNRCPEALEPLPGSTAPCPRPSPRSCFFPTLSPPLGLFHPGLPPSRLSLSDFPTAHCLLLPTIPHRVVCPPVFIRPLRATHALSNIVDIITCEVRALTAPVGRQLTPFVISELFLSSQCYLAYMHLREYILRGVCLHGGTWYMAPRATPGS